MHDATRYASRHLAQFLVAAAVLSLFTLSQPSFASGTPLETAKTGGTIRVGKAEIPWFRIEGFTRYDTAYEIAHMAFGGYDFGSTPMYVASGENYPDALTAGAAAARQRGLLLLTRSDALPEITREGLAYFAPLWIDVIGGTQAISEATYNEICSAAEHPGFQGCRRISGADRYETAVRVAEQLQPAEVIDIAPGYDHAAAALTSSQAAYFNETMLLFGHTPDDMPSTLDYLDTHRDGIVALWYSGTPSEPVLAALIARLLPGTSHMRHMYSDFDIAAASVQAWTDDEIIAAQGTVLVASLSTFPDGLAASTIVGHPKYRWPLILSKPDCAPAQLARRIAEGEVTSLVLVGGPAALDIIEGNTVRFCPE